MITVIKDKNHCNLLYNHCNHMVFQDNLTLTNKLSYGFLEKIYENAMMIEFKKTNIPVVAQSPIEVYYDNEIIGEYSADILVDNKVIIEIKATKSLGESSEAQLLNYLKATKIEVGLLLNFGPRAEVKRKAFDNKNK